MKDGNISRYVTTSLLQKVTNSLSSRKPLCHRHGTQAESTRVIPWQNLMFTLFNSSWVVGEESRIMHTSSVGWDLHQPGQLAYCSVKDRLRQWCAYVRAMYGFAHGLKGSCVCELRTASSSLDHYSRTVTPGGQSSYKCTHAYKYTYIRLYIYTSPYACQVQHRDEFVSCRWPCPIRIASSHSTVIQFSF